MTTEIQGYVRFSLAAGLRLPHYFLSPLPIRGLQTPRLFKRKDDARRIQRFYCRVCQRTFSRAGFSLLYRHWHRRRTELIRRLFSLGVTQRDIARLLKTDKDTVARRLVILGKTARVRMLRDREEATAIRLRVDGFVTHQ